MNSILKIMAAVIILASSQAFALNCDQAHESITDSYIMNNFDYFYDHQNRCLSIPVTVKGGTCVVRAKISLMDDPISDALEFKIDNCEGEEDIHSPKYFKKNYPNENTFEP